MVYISNTVRTFNKGDALASACYWFKLLRSVGYIGCWRRVFFLRRRHIGCQNEFYVSKALLCFKKKKV